MYKKPILISSLLALTVACENVDGGGAGTNSGNSSQLAALVENRYGADGENAGPRRVFLLENDPARIEQLGGNVEVVSGNQNYSLSNMSAEAADAKPEMVAPEPYDELSILPAEPAMEEAMPSNATSERSFWDMLTGAASKPADASASAQIAAASASEGVADSVVEASLAEARKAQEEAAAQAAAQQAAEEKAAAAAAAQAQAAQATEAKAAEDYVAASLAAARKTQEEAAAQAAAQAQPAAEVASVEASPQASQESGFSWGKLFAPAATTSLPEPDLPESVPVPNAESANTAATPVAEPTSTEVANVAPNASSAATAPKPASKGELEQQWRSPFASISFSNGRIQGETACYSFSGSYIPWPNNRVTVMPLSSKGKPCGANEEKASSDFVEALPGSYELIFDGANLLMINENVNFFFSNI